MDDILAKNYDLLRSLADNGNSDALLALGLIACSEEKGHPNITIGLELLEKSANLNNATACRFLGMLYSDDKITQKDLKKSLT